MGLWRKNSSRRSLETSFIGRASFFVLLIGLPFLSETDKGRASSQFQTDFSQKYFVKALQSVADLQDSGISKYVLVRTLLSTLPEGSKMQN